MTTVAHERAMPKNARQATQGSFRNDIQGLRAVAVMLVLLYHAGAPVLPGGFVGVDVFFVISGFLITGLLIKEADLTGHISLMGFYARRAKRILPAASIVLVASVALTIGFLPRTRWEETASQVILSAVYAVNWDFGAGAVDYLAGDSAGSPVQHFWSLAVEEQFYIVWPLILIVVLALSSRKSSSPYPNKRGRFRPVKRDRAIVLGVLLMTVPSLAWSAYYTEVNAGAAYFVTTTRLWELGVGAILGVFTVHLQKTPAFVAHFLGWAGLIAVLAAGFLYTSATPFPGFAALLPTLGAASIIVAGARNGNYGVGRFLALRPMTWVGDISYSLYLWHWPLIVVATFLLGGLDFAGGLIVVVASAIPAYLSYRFVEKPISRSLALRMGSRKTLTFGFGLMLVSVVAGVSILVVPVPAPVVATPTSTIASKDLYGAERLMIDASAGVVTDTSEVYTPTAIEASEDYADVYADGCHQSATEVAAEKCVYGNVDAGFTVAVVGDSHAAQWVPSIQTIGGEDNWRVETYTKSSCPLADVTVADGDASVVYDTCVTWNQAVLAELTGPN